MWNLRFSQEILRKLMVLYRNMVKTHESCQEMSNLKAKTFLRLNTLYCLKEYTYSINIVILKKFSALIFGF